MGEKSEQKKQFIIETARHIFMEKGYKDVTMKDVVEACQISRGGLYLYFNSVEELFLAVMGAEEAETDDVFSDALKEDATAADVLLIFLKEQKKEILRCRDNLSMAMYEYYFANPIIGEKNPIRGRFRKAVRALTQLIGTGIASGEFYDVDAAMAANNIMFVLEGLRICAYTMGVTEDMVDEELLILVSGIVAE